MPPFLPGRDQLAGEVPAASDVGMRRRGQVDPALDRFASAGAHELLLALADGRTLGEACEAVAVGIPLAEVPGLVAETLHRGIQLGWFAEGGGN